MGEGDICKDNVAIFGVGEKIDKPGEKKKVMGEHVIVWMLVVNRDVVCVGCMLLV